MYVLTKASSSLLDLCVLTPPLVEEGSPISKVVLERINIWSLIPTWPDCAGEGQQQVTALKYRSHSSTSLHSRTVSAHVTTHHEWYARALYRLGVFGLESLTFCLFCSMVNITIFYPCPWAFRVAEVYFYQPCSKKIFLFFFLWVILAWDAF
jgi:hypothetical protein